MYRWVLHLISWLRLNLNFIFIIYVLTFWYFKYFLFHVYSITVCTICFVLFFSFKRHKIIHIFQSLSPVCGIFTGVCRSVRLRFSSAAHFSEALVTARREQSLGEVLRWRGCWETEVIIWGTGGFGKVHLDCREMSARHLDSSFTATSHADSTLTWQIHTSHFTRRLFVTGKSQHARCGRVSGVHIVMCVCVCVMCMQVCTCVFKCVSVVMNVTVTVAHTARVRQRNAERVEHAALR